MKFSLCVCFVCEHLKCVFHSFLDQIIIEYLVFRILFICVIFAFYLFFTFTGWILYIVYSCDTLVFHQHTIFIIFGTQNIECMLKIGDWRYIYVVSVFAFGQISFDRFRLVFVCNFLNSGFSLFFFLSFFSPPFVLRVNIQYTIYKNIKDNKKSFLSMAGINIRTFYSITEYILVVRRIHCNGIMKKMWTMKSFIIFVWKYMIFFILKYKNPIDISGSLENCNCNLFVFIFFNVKQEKWKYSLLLNVPWIECCGRLQKFRNNLFFCIEQRSRLNDYLIRNSIAEELRAHLLPSWSRWFPMKCSIFSCSLTLGNESTTSSNERINKLPTKCQNIWHFEQC